MIERWKDYCGVIAVEVPLVINDLQGQVTNAQFYYLCFKNHVAATFKRNGVWHYALIERKLEAAEYVWPWVLDDNLLSCTNGKDEVVIQPIEAQSFDDHLHPLPLHKRMEWQQIKQSRATGAQL